MNEVLGTGVLLDGEDLVRLIARLGLDLLFTSVIVLLVYYRLYRNREFVFTYFVFNVITFSICALLRKVPMEMGFALGLFAVFGILRYRTEEIRMRDLTYMFIVIGVAIINSVSNKHVSLAELLTVNAVIVGVSAIIELHPTIRRHVATPVLYDNLALLHPGREAELHQEIGRRIGAEVLRVQVHRIDLLRDAAELTVFYTTPRPADVADAAKSRPARGPSALVELSASDEAKSS